MKAIITGIGKTGTTVIGQKTSNALGLNYIHEPKDHGKIKSFEKLKSGVIKINIYYINDIVFSQFDKKVLVVRDPRDTFISMLLFNLYRPWEGQTERIKKIIDLLKGKELNPQGMSTIGLFNKINSPKISEFNLQHFARMHNDMVSFAENHPDYYLLRYEDFIQGNLVEYEKYIGCKKSIKFNENVLGGFNYVTRTKAKDNWKNWLLEEDRKVLEPLLLGYMKTFNYMDNWEPNTSPKIMPENCSEYVRKIVNSRRKDKI